LVLHELAEQLRDRLLQDQDITQVEVEGLPSLEIAVEISQETLRRYGLTFSEVASRIGAAAVDIPGGGLKTENGELLVRVKERREYGREFARLPIVTTAAGGQVLLGDIAHIDDGFSDTDRYSLYNGLPAVTIEVYRVGEQTPMQVSKAVRRQLEEFAPSLPPGITTAVEDDRSEVYGERVRLLLSNGTMGLVLVLIILGLFLEARLAFWVMMGIPISFLGSILLLPAADLSINMMSLFAYIIALGIVVDDAIVVGENIYRYRQEGLPLIAAATRGAREVAVPVTFSILTNIATFLPIYFIPGTMGKIFKMIPLVVIIVFLVSLGESLFVLPAHLSHVKRRRRRGFTMWLHDRQQAFSDAFSRWVNRRYGAFLELTLRNRFATVIIAISLLVATLGYAMSGRMGMELFPAVESDFSQATLVMPYGTNVETTDAIIRRILAGARQVIDESGSDQLVTAIQTDIGSGGSHNGRIRVMLAESEIRDAIMTNDQFTNRWREVVGEIPGVEYLVFAYDTGGPGGRGHPISVQLSHRDIRTLEKASQELAAILATYPRVQDIDDGLQMGKEQLDFTMKPAGESIGLTAMNLARQVRGAFYGAEALRQQRGRSEIKVMVRLPENERNSEQAIEDFMLHTPAGAFIPLEEVAEIKRGRAFTKINRRGGRRVIEVGADVKPRSAAGEVLGDMEQNVLPELLNKYKGLTYSFEGHQADMRESLGSLKLTFTLALLAIYALLAIPFKSYLQPLIVMLSIPFGVIGAIFGHLVMGYHLSLPSLFGVVALAGVVVNDSLVMVDFANRRQRDNGDNAHEAIHAAGIQRFRPIILTTLTTFGGLAPMIFETSRQAKFLIPMALSLGYGILFSTGITLVIVPALYLLVANFHAWATRSEETGMNGSVDVPGDDVDERFTTVSREF
ncbi:efflux RND transporter permease subunit, partial [bacterium]|nr:efflux RND transporter permease subunit [candidate division CSSED10-310 bacterium]